MFFNAKEGTVSIGDTSMTFIEFGYGQKPLIILPGLGDGLKTVHGQALFLLYTTDNSQCTLKCIYSVEKKHWKWAVPQKTWQAI